LTTALNGTIAILVSSGVLEFFSSVASGSFTADLRADADPSAGAHVHRFVADGLRHRGAKQRRGAKRRNGGNPEQ
jgi:hypothetical protein